ncbi:MAG: methyltransferase family protein [Thermoplasmata archaeon]
MLDIFVFRVVAGVVLVSSFLVFYISNRGRGGRASRHFDPAATKDVPKALHALWAVVAIVVPLTAIILATFLPETVYRTRFNVAFPGDTFVQVAGLGLYILGSIFLVSSGKHLGRFMIVDIAVAEDHELVTTGPYARIRHPAYTAVLLLGLSAVLFLLNLLLVINLLAVFVIATYRARLEEALLSSEEGFGPEYREYMKRTGMFLPRLRGMKGPDSRE